MTKKVKVAKAKKQPAPAMQKTHKFGKAPVPSAKSVGYKGVKPGKSKAKGKKSFNGGAFAKVKKAVFKM